MELSTNGEAERRTIRLRAALSRLVEIDCFEEQSREIDHEVSRLEAETAELEQVEQLSLSA